MCRCTGRGPLISARRANPQGRNHFEAFPWTGIAFDSLNRCLIMPANCILMGRRCARQTREFDLFRRGNRAGRRNSGIMFQDRSRNFVDAGAIKGDTVFFTHFSPFITLPRIVAISEPLSHVSTFIHHLLYPISQLAAGSESSPRDTADDLPQSPRRIGEQTDHD